MPPAAAASMNSMAATIRMLPNGSSFSGGVGTGAVGLSTFLTGLALGAAFLVSGSALSVVGGLLAAGGFGAGASTFGFRLALTAATAGVLGMGALGALSGWLFELDSFSLDGFGSPDSSLISDCQAMGEF